MRSDPNEMVLQLADIVLEQQHLLAKLERNDLLFIESIRGQPVSAEALSAAAATVLSTAQSVDALSDKLRQLVEQFQRQ